MRIVVEPKEKGRRRIYDCFAICMEEYEFLSINETTREECYVKKIENCQLHRDICTLWTKEKVGGKCQRGSSWTGIVRHSESVHNVDTQRGKRKKPCCKNDRGLGGTPTVLIVFSDTTSCGGQKVQGLESV